MATTILPAIYDLARSLDDLEFGAASTGTANTVVAPGVSDATTNASTTRYRARYLYRVGKASGDRVRIIRPEGFTPASGTLTFDPAVSVSSGAGDAILLTGMFPVEGGTQGGRDNVSYLDLLNMALRDLWAPDQLLITTVANAYSYSLAAQVVWMDRPERVLRLLDPAIVSGYPPRDGSWRIDRVDTNDGVATLWLRVPYTANSLTARLDVRRPANTLVNGGESTEASLMTDVVLPDTRELVEVGKLHAYRVLAIRTGAPDWADAADAQEKRIIADEGIRYLPRPTAAPQTTVAA